MQLKKSDLEAHLVVLLEMKHDKTSVHCILCFSGRAKLTEALRGFYAEALLENVSSLIIIIHLFSET